MPQYSVLIPATCSIQVQVEAEDEESAKDAAFDVNFQIDVTGGAVLHEFETHEDVTEGNVFYGVLNSITVERIDEEP
jgi:hypothetical protein